MSSGRDRASGPDAGAAPSAPASPPLYAYVLDADDDLADELDMRTRLAVRQLATARVLEAETGDVRTGGLARRGRCRDRDC